MSDRQYVIQFVPIKKENKVSEFLHKDFDKTLRNHRCRITDVLDEAKIYDNQTAIEEDIQHLYKRRLVDKDEYILVMADRREFD